MKILGIETSGKICGVCIMENDKIIKEINLNNGLTHSETLLPTIKKIFEETNLTLNDIDLIVCDKGPGSFTGIRIGIATVKAFADSINIPTIGVSSLDALCYNIDENAVICPLIDAKNDNCYFSVFEKIDNKLLKRREYDISNIENILQELKSINAEYNFNFIGDGAITNRELINQYFPNCNIYEQDVSASNIALAGLNSTESKEDLLPMYLKKSQAEINLEAKQNGNKN